MELSEWLPDILSQDIWNKKYRHKDETFDQWLNRISDNDTILKEMILKKKFLFGGRILKNRGLNRGSLANCYSLGYIEDDLGVIFDNAKNLGMSYKAEGGQGLSLSKLRPKGSLIGGVSTSDGIVPFMKLYDLVTQIISQGGSRRGALLMALSVKHPEILDFINIKKNNDVINNANLSVEIDDEFMQNVDINPEYTKIYNEIIKAAWESAEPGVIFKNRFDNYNLMQYCDNYNIECCNACSEVPMPPHGACLLGSINLSQYIYEPFTKNGYFDWIEFSKDIRYVTRAMNYVVDEAIALHPLVEQREMAKNFRQIGIGIMGFADMLIKLGISYGSKESKQAIEMISHTMLNMSLLESSILAKHYGKFPGYTENVLKADILKNADKETIKSITKHGLRNCSLISIAPTGTISTMLNCSSGIEPNFAFEFYRITKSLHGDKDVSYKVFAGIAKEYMEISGETTLPDYFVASHNVDWHDKIDIIAAAQNNVDQSISNTTNLPSNCTLEEVKDLYKYAYEKGLKGATIYRDSSRSGILNLEDNSNINIIQKNSVIKRPKELKAQSFVITSKGVEYAIIIGLMNGRPYEIFAAKKPPLFVVQNGIIIKIKKGSYKWVGDNGDSFPNIQSFSDSVEERATTLYISMLLRHNAEIPFVIKTAKKVDDNISSFTSAVCRVLNKYTEKEESVCPLCGGKVIKEAGCEKCISCGNSKCAVIITNKHVKKKN